MKYILLIAILLTGCETLPEQPVEQPEPPKEVVLEGPYGWDGKHSDAENWGEYVKSEILSYRPETLKKDVGDAHVWCPKYNELSEPERLEVITKMMSEMMRYESSYRPTLTHQEPFNDRFGNPVISSGLMQISVESSNSKRVSDCKVNQQDLFDPEKNLRCSARIITYWINRDEYLGYSFTANNKLNHRGCARYWAVCRFTSSAKSNITARVKQHRLCKG